jgi:CRISPR-associated protein Csm4
MKIVKLRFTSPLHLSRGKSTLDESFDVLHSDTLKSALFVCALDLYGSEEIDASFFEQFTISSAFPFVNDVLFFPKPATLLKGISENIDRKKLKEVNYFSKPVFEQLLKGTLGDLSDKLISNIRYYSESPLYDNQPFKSETVQRVTVNRTYEEEGNTFYTERLFFTEGCGLFFLIDCKPEFLSKIEAALRLLGDNGIGSDKSVGNGQFEFSAIEDFNFDGATKVAPKQVALSLYCPEQSEVSDEEFLNNSAYALIKRGGYIANPENFNRSTLRKKSIVMFIEGSVFPNPPSSKLIGKWVKLTPETGSKVEHEIYRDGRALFFPYNLT